MPETVDSRGLIGKTICHLVFKDFFLKEKARNLVGLRPFLISSTH
jgi:hypothetical protein